MELKVFFLFLWLCFGPVQSSVIKRYYWYENEIRNWTNGQQLCRQKYRGDLATLVSDADLETMHLGTTPVWIGLNHDQTWTWSSGTHSDYRSWESTVDETKTESFDSGDKWCVAVVPLSKKMVNMQCSDVAPLLCYRHNVVLLQKELSWEDALEKCRSMRNAYNHTSFDLLSVEQNELEYAWSHAKKASTSKVWVGLRFLAGSWFWVNGLPVSLSLKSCPKFPCAALVLSTGSIEPTACSEKLNLLCYGTGQPQW